MQTFKVKIIDVKGKDQLEFLLAENPEVIEEEMKVLARQLPTAIGSLDILAIDKSGRLMVIDTVNVADNCQLDRGLKAYEFVKSNEALLERFLPGIDSKQEPRLILIAPVFSDNLIKLAKYTALNADGLLELKEYTAIQSSSGEKAVITHPMNLGALGANMTQLKQQIEHLEEQLKEKTDKLNDLQRFALIGENTAMVAHDLKNPIQVLSISSYNAKLSLENSDAQTKKILRSYGLNTMLETIEKQVDYMNRIISDLQDLTLDIKPKIAEGSLIDLIKDVTAGFIPPNVKLKISMSTEKAHFDYHLMKRTMVNLVTNAVQAMPDGGEITIRTLEEGVWTVIQIEDTGIGIPKESMANLFSAFATTKTTGMGMGLVVVKRIVEAHKGTISVGSEAGKGTTFTIRIPIIVSL